MDRDLGYAPTVLDDKVAHAELLTKLRDVPSSTSA